MTVSDPVQYPASLDKFASAQRSVVFPPKFRRQLATELEQLIELDQSPDLLALTALRAPRPDNQLVMWTPPTAGFC